MALINYDNITNVSKNGVSFQIKNKIIPDDYKAPKYVASYIKAGDNMKACRKIGLNGKPRGICIHNTEFVTNTKTNDAAEVYAAATWWGNLGGTLVHYYVHKKSVWKLLKDDECGYHASDWGKRIASHRKGETIGGNFDCIAIECVGEDKSGKVTTSEDTTAKLTAWLCFQYDLNPDTDIYTHNYFYGAKYCPAYILPHWDAFMTKVKGYYEKLMNKSTGIVLVQKSEGRAAIRSAPSKTAPLLGRCIKGNEYVMEAKISNKEGRWFKHSGIEGYSMYMDGAILFTNGENTKFGELSAKAGNKAVCTRGETSEKCYIGDLTKGK
jgi:hypothetical protein